MKNHGNKKGRIGQRGSTVVSAGTGMCVHIPFRLNPIASLAWLGKQLPCPLHVKAGGKTVKEVAVENPLSRGGHTHTRSYKQSQSFQIAGETIPKEASSY